jgi:leukotriene-A4 hydrolase
MLKSLDSFEFKATLEEFFKDKPKEKNLLSEVDWQTWFYKPGMPPKPPFDDSMVKVCTYLANKWLEKKAKPFEPSLSDIKDWVANQSVVFLEAIQRESKQLSIEDARLLIKTYGFETTQNVEVLSRALILRLMKRDEDAFEPVAELLGQVGRMKFVRPLYSELKRCDLDYAKRVFEKNKDFYHPICRGMVEKDLFGKDGKL